MPRAAEQIHRARAHEQGEHAVETLYGKEFFQHKETRSEDQIW